MDPFNPEADTYWCPGFDSNLIRLDIAHLVKWIKEIQKSRSLKTRLQVQEPDHKVLARLTDFFVHKQLAVYAITLNSACPGDGFERLRFLERFETFRMYVEYMRSAKKIIELAEEHNLDFAFEISNIQFRHEPRKNFKDLIADLELFSKIVHAMS